MFPEVCSLALTKLILHGHYDLHLVQTVQTQVLHEVRGRLQLWDTNTETIKTLEQNSFLPLNNKKH